MSGEYTIAVLRVVEGTVTGPTELFFDFNPGEYSVDKTSTWTRPQMKGGKQTGKPEFQGANAQSVKMEILFDQYVSGPDVAKSVSTLIDWVKPTDDSVAKKKPQPPIVLFEWGDNPVLTSFRAYVKSVAAKFVLFDGSGTPLRATATVTLEEVPIPAPKQNPTSGSIHGRRTHVLAEGDTLASIAWTEYEDPALWRGIATFNGIDDPLRVRPGQSILVPTADEARRRS
jgi:hypothetical protein